VTRFLLSALFLGAMATTASAQPSAGMNWDTCTGPISKSILPGTQARLVVSATGMSVQHNAYQTFVILGSGNAGDLRDAWRFDAAGCQGSSFITIEHLAPAALAKTCPSAQGNTASIQIKDYSYDALTGKARAVLANTYPAGMIPVPTTRYFLAGFLFDHLFSVNGPTTPGADCGGLEVAVCAHFDQTRRTSWLEMSNGVEHPFAISSEYVTSNDPNNAIGCPGATPAESKTWGQVKAQYKR
jgi:hypothetical protein